jgi:Glycosyl transferase family 2
MKRVPFASALPKSWKLQIKSRLPDVVLRQMRPNFTKPLRSQSTDASTPTTDAPMFAIIGAWHEGDVIAATVRHAFGQGATRVFLIDNDSPDNTVDRALSEGAELVCRYSTPRYDEHLRITLLNQFMRSISVASGCNQIWWMVIDADEFIVAPDGRRVLDFLATLDQRCRVVGVDVVDHYPSPGIQYVDEFNLLQTQPLCIEKQDLRCVLRHHKHPLIKWDVGRSEIRIENGCHQVRSHKEVLREPIVSAVMHHFPYRSERDTKERLRAIGLRGIGEDERDENNLHAHLRARIKSIDDVFAGRYEDVLDYRTGKLGLDLDDWRELSEPGTDGRITPWPQDSKR